jgi:hypothetical protein
LNELRRSNNVVRALDHARVPFETYQEWRESGFLSDEMLQQAESSFRLKHPDADIIVSVSDNTVQDASATPSTVEARGYDADNVLDADGWSNADEYFDGE